MPFIYVNTQDTTKINKLGYPPTKNTPQMDTYILKSNIDEVIKNNSEFPELGEFVYFYIKLREAYPNSKFEKTINYLGIEIKSILSNNQLLVRGNKKLLEDVRNKEKIFKYVLESIEELKIFEYTNKIGESLLKLIEENKKDIYFSLRFYDNLSPVEEAIFLKIINNKLDEYDYLNYSKQIYAKGSSATVKDIAKLSFVESVNAISKAKPQNYNVNLPSDVESPILKKRDDSPIICILDSGICKSLQPFCYKTDSYKFDSIDDNIDHGTRVASIALFGIDLLSRSKVLEQQSKLIVFKVDDDGYEGKFFEDALFCAIDKYSNETKIFCCSYNFESLKPIERLNIVRRLDKMIQRKNIIFINSAGNIRDTEILHHIKDYPNYLFKYNTLCPSETKNIVAVGSVSSESYSGNCVLSYHNRIGISLFFQSIDYDKYKYFKPDVYTYGGNFHYNGKNVIKEHSKALQVISSNGVIDYDLGTSFSAPYIALCFSKLYEYYDKYYNNELYRAILLNKCHYYNMNKMPIFYYLDYTNITQCNNGIYINFEDTLTPYLRSEDLKRCIIVKCKSIEFFYPKEAESIDIVTVHSNNYLHQDIRKYNTRLIVELIKENGKSLKKSHGNPSSNCPNTFGHYKLKNYEGICYAKIHIETRSIPKSSIDDIEVRFGVSIRINIKEKYIGQHNSIYQKVKNYTEQIDKYKTGDIGQKQLTIEEVYS